MSIWFFIVLVVGILYIVNRLTSTTDLPVSAVLAEARELVEQGHRRHEPAAAPAHATAARFGSNDLNPVGKQYSGSRAA